jgi:hypothetical protein
MVKTKMDSPTKVERDCHELRVYLVFYSALEGIDRDASLWEGNTMSINMEDEKNIPPNTEACYETVANQEEIYLETTEEELRADLTSEPIVAEQLRKNREKLEVEWELEISDDRCE